MRPSLRARRPPTSSQWSKTRGFFFLGGLHVEHACRDVRVRMMHVLLFLLPTYCCNSSSPALHSMSLPFRSWHYTHSMYYCQLRSICLQNALRCAPDVLFSPNVIPPVATHPPQRIRDWREHMQITCTAIGENSFRSRGSISWLRSQEESTSRIDRAMDFIVMI